MGEKAERALELGTDLVEFRIDHLERPAGGRVIDELSRFSDRCILTVRSKEQGGRFEGDDAERVGLLADICSMRPAYVDVEFDTAKRFAGLAGKLRDAAREVIVSWHDLEGTPDQAT